MEKIKVLYGFNAPSFIKGVNNCLLGMGYEVDYIIRTSKSTIRDFLTANKEYDAAVLLEVFGDSEGDSVVRYDADELAVLTDYTGINVIPVLNGNLKGSYFMQVLYDAGITSAVFQQTKTHGLTPKDIAGLIMKKRTRKMARDYYGIPRRLNEPIVLESELINQYVEYLSQESNVSVASRFVEVCRKLSMRQIADFIKRMPDGLLEELKHYEEFYIVLDIIRKCGFNFKIKRPKAMQIGLITPKSNLELTCRKEELGNVVLEPEADTGSYDVHISAVEEEYAEDDEDEDDYDYEEEDDWLTDDAESDEEAPEQEQPKVLDYFFQEDDAESEEQYLENDLLKESLHRDMEDRTQKKTDAGMNTQPEDIPVPLVETAESDKSEYTQQKHRIVRRRGRRSETDDMLETMYVTNSGTSKETQRAVEQDKKIESAADIEGDYLSKLIKMSPEKSQRKEIKKTHELRNVICMLIIMVSFFLILYFTGAYVQLFDFIYGR